MTAQTSKQSKTVKVYPYKGFGMTVEWDSGEVSNWTFHYDSELNVLFSDKALPSEMANEIATYIAAHAYLREKRDWSEKERQKANEAARAAYALLNPSDKIKDVRFDSNVTVSFSGLGGFGQFSYTPVHCLDDEELLTWGTEQAAITTRPMKFAVMNELVGIEVIHESLIALLGLVKLSSDYRVKHFTKVMSMRQFMAHTKPDTSFSAHIRGNQFRYNHDKGTITLSYQNLVAYKDFEVKVTLKAGRALMNSWLAAANLTVQKDTMAELFGEEDESDARIVRVPCYTFMNKLLEIAPAADHLVTVTIEYKVLEKLPWAQS